MKKVVKVILCSCFSCGESVPYGNFCVLCGNPTQKNVATIKVRSCPYCGANTYIDSTFCVACGKEIKDRTNERTADINT